MKLGCAAYSYRQLLQSGALTLHGFVEECARRNLDGVELTAYYFPATDREALHALKRHCFRKGLQVAGTAVGSKFTLADPAERAAQVKMTREWIDHSVLLGAPCVRVFAGSVPEGVAEEQAMAWAVECLQECVAFGAERGVVVALENHGGITTTAAQVLRIAGQVRSTWFGLNLDFGNFREDPYEEMRQVAPLAVTTHAKVSIHTPSGGREPVDYERVRSILESANYRGYLNIEYEEPEDPTTGVRRFIDELKEVFG